MSECSDCKARDFCTLNPDLSLEDAEQCFQTKNAEIVEVPEDFIEYSFQSFKINKNKFFNQINKY